MTTVAIYAEGGKGVGLGHIMRTCVLAEALSEKGCSVRYFLPSKAFSPYVRRNGFPTIRLPDSGKFRKLEAHIGGEPADLLVLDSYELTAPALARLRRHASATVLFDDNASGPKGADAIINANAYAEGLREKYGEAGAASKPSRAGARGNPVAGKRRNKTLVLLGPKYLLLRKEFRGAKKRRVRKKARDVLVILGGALLADVVGGVLRALSVLPGVERVHVVCGPFFPKLRGLPAVPFKVMLHRSPPAKKLAQLMESCDIAVSGGGQSLYELARCGVPAVGIILGRDQKRNLGALSEKGACLAVTAAGGTARRAALESNLRKLLNPRRRGRMSSRAQGLVDGKGADRVVSRLLALVGRRRF